MNWSVALTVIDQGDIHHSACGSRLTIASKSATSEVVEMVLELAVVHPLDVSVDALFVPQGIGRSVYHDCLGGAAS